MSPTGTQKSIAKNIIKKAEAEAQIMRDGGVKEGKINAFLRSKKAAAKEILEINYKPRKRPAPKRKRMP